MDCVSVRQRRGNFGALTLWSAGEFINASAMELALWIAPLPQCLVGVGGEKLLPRTGDCDFPTLFWLPNFPIRTGKRLLLWLPNFPFWTLLSLSLARVSAFGYGLGHAFGLGPGRM